MWKRDAGTGRDERPTFTGRAWPGQTCQSRTQASPDEAKSVENRKSRRSTGPLKCKNVLKKEQLSAASPVWLSWEVEYEEMKLLRERTIGKGGGGFSTFGCS